MNILGVIPSRYASTRFPGKPLAMIQGKSMINRVWEQASKSELLSKVCVATDDARIYDHVKNFGGSAIMTSPDHQNGTSRCREALEILLLGESGEKIDVVINIQGDEPFINPLQIDQVAALFNDPSVDIGTLAKELNEADELFNSNVVKTVFDASGFAMYFSRQALPFVRGAHQENWLKEQSFFKHIGIYGYRSGVLPALVNLSPGSLEKAENLEQLRWLENGYKIKIGQTDFEGIAIDTPDDLLKLTNIDE